MKNGKIFIFATIILVTTGGLGCSRQSTAENFGLRQKSMACHVIMPYCVLPIEKVPTVLKTYSNFRDLKYTVTCHSSEVSLASTVLSRFTCWFVEQSVCLFPGACHGRK